MFIACPIIRLAYTIKSFVFQQLCRTLHRMRGPFPLIALALLCCANAYGEEASSRLTAVFAAAIAEIAPRSSAQPIQLPSLTFTVNIEASCPASFANGTVSISIADTKIRAAIVADGPTQQSIQVPEKQLGPISANDFCIVGAEPGSAAQLQLRDALSAQVSLRCVGESQESITYSTVPLEVSLQCVIPESIQAL